MISKLQSVGSKRLVRKESSGGGRIHESPLEGEMEYIFLGELGPEDKGAEGEVREMEGDGVGRADWNRMPFG